MHVRATVCGGHMHVYMHTGIGDARGGISSKTYVLTYVVISVHAHSKRESKVYDICLLDALLRACTDTICTLHARAPAATLLDLPSNSQGLAI